MSLKDLHLHWGECRYKGNKYRTYSLARSFRENGKNKKEIIYKLGKLSESDVLKWRSLLKSLKKPDSFITTLNDLKILDHFSYLDIAVINTIWDYWQLDKIFPEDGKREVTISKIARILSINRCIDPVSKSQVPDWFEKTSLPWMLDIETRLINSSRIFRELEVIESHKDAICKHIFEQLTQRNPDSMSSVFYDLSSTTFTGSRCVLMKWGHCKEGYKNHIVLAIVVNTDGLPFYWEVLPGNTADVSTLVWLVDRLKSHFKIKKTTLVFDRGMVSEDNLTLLENENTHIKYITAMNRNQIKTITDFNFSGLPNFTTENIEKRFPLLSDFTKLNGNTYYREMKIEGKRRYILCFNPQLFKDQRKARDQAVENFKFFLKNLNIELSEARKSRQRKITYEKFKRGIVKYKLTTFIDISLKLKYLRQIRKDGSEQKIRTYYGTICVDEKAKKIAGEMDGFWLLATNHTEQKDNLFEISAPEAIYPYRDKAVIESAFRDIKSFIQVSPVCVWKENHVKSHYTICVLSHLINRTLTLRLHKTEGEETKDIVTHEKLYKILSSCMVNHIEIENISLSTYSRTKMNIKQKELLNRIGLKNLISEDVIKITKKA